MNIGNLISMIKRYGGNGGSSTPAPVVILTETELTVINPGSQYTLETPLEKAPMDGSVCKVIWSGVEYTSPAVDVAATLGASIAAFVLGNTDLAGLTETFGVNPAPDAPFLLVLYPDGGEDGGEITYGMLVSNAEVIANPTPVLSIVQTEGAASGGEDTDYIITVDGDMTTTQKWAEVAAAYKAGRHVRLVMKMTSEGIVNNYEYLLIGHSTSAGALTTLLYYTPGILLNNPVRYTVTAADDGGIKIIEASGD